MNQPHTWRASYIRLLFHRTATPVLETPEIDQKCNARQTHRQNQRKFTLKGVKDQIDLLFVLAQPLYHLILSKTRKIARAYPYQEQNCSARWSDGDKNQEILLLKTTKL